MLYVTTRNNRDAYTAQRVLRENRGPDGGLYVPFREPVFSWEEIDALKEKSFHQCVAEVLNRLFNTEADPVGCGILRRALSRPTGESAPANYCRGVLAQPGMDV